jgi:NAD(P)-dependent dehydrogenase (short-subunit alcohol dehydrogenase family)
LATALIIGASRGIGHELARQYRADGWRVLSTARDDTGIEKLAALGCEPFKLDVTDAASVSSIEWKLDGEKLDVAFLNAGVYGARTSALEPPLAQDFDAVMHTNVLAAMQIIPQLASALRAGSKLAVISSRMGSIGTRSSSSGWLYRASKAALNSVLKDASIVLQPQGVVCVSFHPGWVRTDMGGAGADISVEESARGMRSALSAAGAAQNGAFLNYDGSSIAW